MNELRTELNDTNEKVKKNALLKLFFVINLLIFFTDLVKYLIKKQIQLLLNNKLIIIND